jgi:hypothetical protein
VVATEFERALGVEAGEVAKAMSEPFIDLFHACSDRFPDWLRGGKPHQTHQNGAGEAPADMAVHRWS